MARKKQLTYNEMVNKMKVLQEDVIAAADRIAEVIGDELDYRTAAILGDLSTAELRRVARLMFDNASLFVNLVELDTSKPQRSRDTEDAPMVEGEVQSNYAKNRWEIWDMEANKRIGMLRDGMRVEILENGKWVPARVRMRISDIWHFDVEEDAPGTRDGMEFMLSGLRVRIRGTDRA